MIKLYCFPRSGNSREVKLVLEEKGIPYQSVNIRENDVVNNDEDFKKASPNKKVPAIVDGTVYMCNSYSINEYLESEYPDHPVLPKDESARAEIKAWVAHYDKSLALKIGLLLIETILKPAAEQKEHVKEMLRGEIKAGLKELNEKLSGREYFFGEYSLADISMTPHLAAMGRLGVEIDDDLTDLKAWMQRVKSRPNFDASAG